MKRTYKYYLLERGRSIGTQPPGYIDCADYDKKTYIPEIDQAAYGWLVYDRRLSKDEISKFELMEEV